MPQSIEDSQRQNFLISVRYGAGRGGFSLARPRPYMGPGRVLSGNPRPAPVRGPAALIPCMGPRLLPRIFNGDPAGVWVGRGLELGEGQGMPKKTPHPWPLSGAGRGKGPGARVFRGPVRPVTDSISDCIDVWLEALHSDSWLRTIGYRNHLSRSTYHTVTPLPRYLNLMRKLIFAPRSIFC